MAFAHYIQGTEGQLQRTPFLPIKTTRMPFFAGTRRKQAFNEAAAEGKGRKSPGQHAPENTDVVMRTGMRDLEKKVKPMLAEIGSEPFDNPDWIFEHKYDGYRALANVADGKVELYSRNHNSFNADYPEVVAALSKLGHNAILDGEVVAEGPDGRDRFQLLQNRANQHVKVRYYAFDILHLNGYDLSQVPLVNRKSLLKKLVAQLRSRIILYSDYVKGEGVSFYKKAVRENREGIIAKEAKSPYRYNTRSREWLKIKIHQQQEAVIVGVTEPRGSREHFGSLLLAVRENNEWRYIGNCGTGFSHDLLGELFMKMKPYFTKQSPFKKRIRSASSIQWIRPHFVCQVKFSEWTSEGILRQPVFLGLRRDKKATEVKREIPTVNGRETTSTRKKR